jgi:glycosyltransferase involved in cell wall biosynthesis
VSGFSGRVALCFGTYPPERNGGADFVARLAETLVEVGLEPHVVTSARGDPETTVEAGVVVHRIVRDWSLGSAGRAELRRANGVLRDAGAEVVHVLFPDSVLQEQYRLPALLGARRIPLVPTWWNLGLGRRSPVALRLQSLALLARARVLTSHNPMSLRFLRRLALGRSVQWLPVGNNMVDAGPRLSRDDARKRLELEPGPAWLGYFGQLDPTRGVEDLFAALASLRRERDVRLVMIGSAGRRERYEEEPASAAYLEAVLELPRAFGIEDGVRWTDYLPDEDVLDYLRAVDVCVLPYRRNSLGRSALATALETGTPTVLAGTAAGIEPLRAGEHVLLVPPASPDDLRVAVSRLLEDEGARSRLALGAREAARYFSWRYVAERAIAVYERACS